MIETFDYKQGNSLRLSILYLAQTAAISDRIIQEVLVRKGICSPEELYDIQKEVAEFPEIREIQDDIDKLTHQMEEDEKLSQELRSALSNEHTDLD